MLKDRLGYQPFSVRLIAAAVGAVLLLWVFSATAGAQGAGEEYLPDCGAGVTTNCVVGVELNGNQTQAIKANLARVPDPTGVVGSQFTIYFTQPNPVSYEPNWGCSGGSTPTIDNGTTPPTITCPPGETPIPGTPSAVSCLPAPIFGGYGGTNRCGNLSQIAPAGSKLGVTVNVGSSDPKVAVIRGGRLGGLDSPNKTWRSAQTPNGTEVTLELEVGRTSSLNACNLNPFSGPVECGDENSQATWTGNFAAATLLNLDGNAVKEFGDIARGTTLATNAWQNAAPTFDRSARTLAFQTGGPHFEQGGGALNDGFLYAFLPDSFLEAGTGFGLPPGLNSRETLAMLGIDKVTAGSPTQQLEPTASDVTGGVIYSLPKFGFSSPKFNYKRLKAAGAFTSKASATRKKVSVTLDVGGKSKVSVAGKLGSKSVCSGSKSASRAGSVTVACKLSSAGKKAMAKAKKGAKVNVKVTVKAKKTETKTTYALIP